MISTCTSLKRFYLQVLSDIAGHSKKYCFFLYYWSLISQHIQCLTVTSQCSRALKFILCQTFHISCRQVLVVNVEFSSDDRATTEPLYHSPLIRQRRDDTTLVNACLWLEVINELSSDLDKHWAWPEPR